MTGTLTLSGITDEELEKIIKVKESSTGKLLTESLGSPHKPAYGQSQDNKPQVYDGIQFTWSDPIGAKFAADALMTLAPASSPSTSPEQH